MNAPLDPEGQLERLRPAWARVDLTRLAANYRAVAASVPVPLMPVIKSDAYGHGAARVGRALESLGVPLLAVAYPEEGAALRAAGIRVPIVVLAVFGPAQAEVLLEQGLTPVVSTPETLEGILGLAKASGRRVGVHLKLDTGMARLGFDAAEFASAAARLADSGLAEVEGAMTHLASADEHAAATAEQLDRFDQALADLARRGIRPRWVHAANSAGLLHLRSTHTLARPGLLLYGLRPRPLTPSVEVRPVMSVAARIGLVKSIAVGTRVSYGGRWIASRASRVATIPLGYADGIPRAMEEGGSLSIGGRRAPVAGAVCMDLMMADVTEIAEVREGDEAVFFGDDPTAWDVADRAATNVWDILTRVGSRVPRVYVEDGRIVAVEARYR